MISQFKPWFAKTRKSYRNLKNASIIRILHLKGKTYLKNPDFFGTSQSTENITFFTWAIMAIAISVPQISPIAVLAIGNSCAIDGIPNICW
jgi:hypothetical protein